MTPLDDLAILDARIEPILRTIRAWQQTRSDSNKSALWDGLCSDLKILILKAQRDAANRQKEQTRIDLLRLITNLMSPLPEDRSKNHHE
jgi:hypothetical protein